MEGSQEATSEGRGKGVRKPPVREGGKNISFHISARNINKKLFCLKKSVDRPAFYCIIGYKLENKIKRSRWKIA